VNLSNLVITDPNEFSKVGDEVEAFIKEYGEFPFALPTFIKSVMNLKIHENQVPVIIITKDREKIVGFASYVLRKIGISYGFSLLDYYGSVDLIIKDGYGQVVATNLIKVTEKLGNIFTIMYFPAESSNLEYLRQACLANQTSFFICSFPSISHGVVPVLNSWNDFLKFRGRYFQKDLRAMERKLDNEGSWRATLFESTNAELDKNVLNNKIKAVDKSSWKGLSRQANGQTYDPVLSTYLEASDPFDYKSIATRKIWLLELNNTPIAFSLIFKFKNIAFIAKTSFTEKYRKLSPGIFITNYAIRDLFQKKEVYKIDFMSTNSMVKFWDATILPRYRIVFGKQIGVSALMARQKFETITANLGHKQKLSLYDATARERLTNRKPKIYSLFGIK